jgi:ribokinase
MNRDSKNKDATWDILGFGAVAVDDLVYLDAFPSPDSKSRVRARERHGGGLCATALVAAARLGARCAYAGVLGNEELSRFSLDELSRENIDVSQVLVDESARPHHSTILVEAQNQTRTILSFDAGVTPFPPHQITPQVLERARVVFLDHTTRGASIIKAARSANVPTVADVERMAPGVEDWISGVNHLIIGEKLAQQLTGENEASKAVQALGESRTLAIVTCGERGSVACGLETQRQVLATPAFAVSAIDTTGCGDVFHGAYAAELARGSDVATRLRVASAVAAMKARFRGGRGGLPSREEALRFAEMGHGS